MTYVKNVEALYNHVFHSLQVSMEDEFLQLSHCELVHLIQRDELNVPDEKDVYNAVLKWVRHDEETRQPKMEQILQAVRYGFIIHLIMV